jgi:hypothetical protein
MTVLELLSDKLSKPKEKTDRLSLLITTGETGIDELIRFASVAKESDRATCIEALEHATVAMNDLMTEEAFLFVTTQLACKAPRVKWESARVIANTVHLYPAHIGNAVTNLLVNTENPGTVVRWSAASALAAIVKMKTSFNEELLPALEAIAEREEKNSIRKIYLEALKKARK